MSAILHQPWTLCTCGEPSTHCGPFGNMCDRCFDKNCVVREGARSQTAEIQQTLMDSLRTEFEDEVVAAEKQHVLGMTVVDGIYKQIAEKFGRHQQVQRWAQYDNLSMGLSIAQREKLRSMLMLDEAEFFQNERNLAYQAAVPARDELSKLTEQAERLKEEIRGLQKNLDEKARLLGALNAMTAKGPDVMKPVFVNHDYLDVDVSAKFNPANLPGTPQHLKKAMAALKDSPPVPQWPVMSLPPRNFQSEHMTSERIEVKPTMFEELVDAEIKRVSAQARALYEDAYTVEPSAWTSGKK